MGKPEQLILTTTVGSYPIPDWLAALPSEQARLDATRVVFDIQRRAGIDLPTDGELYRFDVNHPDTNGMIDYFLRPALRYSQPSLSRSDHKAASADQPHMQISPQARWRRRRQKSVKAALTSPPIANSLAAYLEWTLQVHRHQPLHAGPHAA